MSRWRYKTSCSWNGCKTVLRSINKKTAKHDIIRLVDYQKENNNLFHVINQWTVVENETKRPDVVIFVNRLELALSEPIALMINETGESKSKANEYGFRYFSSIEKLKLYMEKPLCACASSTKKSPAKLAKEKKLQHKGKSLQC